MIEEVKEEFLLTLSSLSNKYNKSFCSHCISQLDNYRGFGRHYVGGLNRRDSRCARLWLKQSSVHYLTVLLKSGAQMPNFIVNAARTERGWLKSWTYLLVNTVVWFLVWRDTNAQNTSWMVQLSRASHCSLDDLRSRPNRVRIASTMNCA